MYTIGILLATAIPVSIWLYAGRLVYKASLPVQGAAPLYWHYTRRVAAGCFILIAGILIASAAYALFSPGFVGH